MRQMCMWMIGAGSLLIMLITGCVPRPVTTHDQPMLPETGRESIAVMPFLTGKHGSNIGEAIIITLDCAVSQLRFNTRDVRGGAGTTLTRYMQEVLKGRLGERMIPLEKVYRASDVLTRDQTVDTLRSLATRLGEELNADHVVAGTVWRYRERVGTAGASSSPASVAFAVYIIRVTDGKLLWKTAYSRTQKPLSNNILHARTFFKQGARWLSVDELARYGISEVVEQFPYKNSLSLTEKPFAANVSLWAFNPDELGALR
jgi:TolB-like protein